MATSDPNNTAKEVTQATGGGELAVHGPVHVDRERMIALLKDAPRTADVADGASQDEPLPPGHGGAARSAATAQTSTAVVEAPRDLPNTPAPLASWMATLAGKGGFPADAQIAVSNTHVIVSNRQRMRYYDKAGSPLGSDLGSASFFMSGLSLKDAAGNAIDRFNDLRVIFDSYRKRFWVTAYAGFSGAANVPAAKRRTFIPMAVSKTQNPQDGWYFYYWDGAAQEGNAGSAIWQPGDAPDYPIVGIDKLAITITHAVNNGGFRYWRVTLTPADPLANGQAQGGWQFWSLKNPDGSTPWVITPAVHHGSPKGGRAYWLGRQGSDSVVVWAITHPFDAARKVEHVAVKVAPAFTDPVNGQQKGTTKLIKFTNLGTAVTKACFRSELLHMVANDAHDWGGIGKVRTSIRYLRLPVAAWPSVPAPPASGGVSRVFGGGNPNEEIDGLKHYGWAAVEANKNGDAIIGYARTGEKLYPEVRASAYLATETDIRPSRQVKAGDKAADNPNYPNASDVLPWGDTSGASVDPADDTAIWIAQQYASNTASNNGNYDIWVAKFFGA